MRRLPLAVLVPLLLPLAAALSLAVAGCGGGGASPSPAPSVAVADFPAVANPRVVEVFVKADTTPAKARAMAARIAHMPEVERYTFVSHEDAVKEFLAGDPANLLKLGANPLPGSFRVLVKEPSEVETVARRFFDDPIVDDSSPGAHDGVSYQGHRRQ